MAVHAADDLVDDRHGLGLGSTPFLALRVVQVVGMDDAHHMLELVRPAPTVVIPIQVLGLLQHRHIRLHRADVLMLRSDVLCCQHGSCRALP